MKWTVVLMLGAGILVSSCAGSGTKPHDMSVKEHRKAAEKLEREARHYNDRAETEIDGATYVDLWTLAAGYQNHADEHREAARVLESQADPQACVDHPRSHVETCPLAAYKVLDVESIPQGVKVLYAANSGTEFEGHLMCHQAHMSLHSETREASCPLESGVQVSVVQDKRGTWVVLTSKQPEKARELQGIYVKKKQAAPSTPETPEP